MEMTNDQSRMSVGRIGELDSGEGGEAAVDYEGGAGDEFGGVGEEEVDRAVEFVGRAEATEGSLAADGVSAFGEGTVLVGEETAVLFAEEEAGNEGVDAHAALRVAGEVHAQIADLVFIDAAGRRNVVAPGLLDYALPGQRMRWPLAHPSSLFDKGGTLKARINGEAAEQSLSPDSAAR